MKQITILHFFIGILALLFLNQCATGHCPREGEETSQDVNQRIWVYKYDGSKQCQPDSRLSPDKMLEQDFSNIKVWDQDQKHDGLARVQMCGAYTGNTNRFLIEKKDLPFLKSKGYEVWDF